MNAHAATDPVFCFNAEQNKWFMYYTARRATAPNTPGVTWVHGSNIGLAESSDGGATWTYRGLDACIIQLPSGTWRIWYKDERAAKPLSYADSPDLLKWETKGIAVTNFNGENPKVFHWKDRYWLVADCWQNGMRVWSSDDCTDWKLQEAALFGSHGDVVVSGGRAWWFYFGGPNAPRSENRRRTAINVVELSVLGGKLIADDPSQPTYIDLKPEREVEK